MLVSRWNFLFQNNFKILQAQSRQSGIIIINIKGKLHCRQFGRTCLNFQSGLTITWQSNFHIYLQIVFYRMITCAWRQLNFSTNIIVISSKSKSSEIAILKPQSFFPNAKNLSSPWDSFSGSSVCPRNKTPGRDFLYWNIPVTFKFMCCIFFERNNWM